MSNTPHLHVLLGKRFVTGDITFSPSIHSAISTLRREMSVLQKFLIMNKCFRPEPQNKKKMFQVRRLISNTFFEARAISLIIVIPICISVSISLSRCLSACPHIYALISIKVSLYLIESITSLALSICYEYHQTLYHPDKVSELLQNKEGIKQSLRMRYHPESSRSFEDSFLKIKMKNNKKKVLPKRGQEKGRMKIYLCAKRCIYLFFFSLSPPHSFLYLDEIITRHAKKQNIHFYGRGKIYDTPTLRSM